METLLLVAYKNQTMHVERLKLQSEMQMTVMMRCRRRNGVRSMKLDASLYAVRSAK
jgi:hypothetical protein